MRSTAGRSGSEDTSDGEIHDREARQARTVQALTLVEQLWRDLRLAVRRLCATPVFTAFAVVSLALGLGVTTAVYSAVGSLFWSPSSIEDADHLAVLTQQAPGSRGSWGQVVSRTDFQVLRSQVRLVPAPAASTAVFDALNDGTRTSAFRADAVTGNYFAMVRLPLSLGRGIQEADDRPGADPVVVLSYDFWQSKIGGDRGIVGRTVRIGSHPFVVIGVTAETVQRVKSIPSPAIEFGFYGDGWIPLVDEPIVTGPLATGHNQSDLTVIARIPAGIALQSVASEVTGIGAALDRSAPVLRDDPALGLAPLLRSWSVTTAAATAREHEAGTSNTGGALVLLAGLVLVVACTNIANLTLGRGASRQHEFTVRRALGASRGRLVREQCAESFVLAAFGGLGAVLVARALCQAFTTDIPFGNFQVVALQPTLNAPALIAAGGLLLVSLVVFGIVPALQLTGASLRERLAGEAAGAPPGRWKGRRRLIAWQVTISTGLILLAGASTRAVTAEALHDPGFDLRHLAVGFVDLHLMHGDATRTQTAIVALESAAQAQPGFESVALTSGFPVAPDRRVRRLARVSTVDQPLVQPTDGSWVLVIPSTPEIFRTLSVPVLHGRGFDDRDTATATPVIVVSEHVARQIFGTTDVVGRQMRYLSDASDAMPMVVEVIGVARDTDTTCVPCGVGTPLWLLDRHRGAVYVPLAQQDEQTVFIVGRTAGDPEPMVGTFAGIARQADPDLAVQFASTGPMVLTPAYVVLRMAAKLSGGLSILSVALAMLGLYGVLSHVVARRTREIGVRLALGAEASRIRRMIVGEGLHPVVWGLGLGLLVGISTRLVLRALDGGPNISAIDPPAFAVAAVTLVTAGVFACYLPARRASQVDPNVALSDL